MTEKQTELFEQLIKDFNTFSIKLFGNGTKVGCMDERLSHVERDMASIKELMPNMVTEEKCAARHSANWTFRLGIAGLIATWIGLLLRVMGVL